MEKYSPAYVVIDRHHDILRFAGQTGKYIEPSPGAASLNLFKILRKPLGPAAKADRKTVVYGKRVSVAVELGVRRIMKNKVSGTNEKATINMTTNKNTKPT